jgi:hypothetical protein
MQISKELSGGGEKRFRMLWQPIMSGVSHAQRLPRQRLSANRQGAHRGISTDISVYDYLRSYSGR